MPDTADRARSNKIQGRSSIWLIKPSSHCPLDLLTDRWTYPLASFSVTKGVRQSLSEAKANAFVSNMFEATLVHAIMKAAFVI